jgi:ATP-dependent DNA helicase PIF1
MNSTDIVSKVATFLQPLDFKHLKLTNRSSYKALDSTKLWQNAQLQAEHTCYQIFRLGRNVFLTGPGGTGKTHTLKLILKYAAKLKWEAAITATTGMAAAGFNGGRTIHSFSGLALGKEPLDSLLEKYDRKGSIPGRASYTKTRLLLVDEVSMMGASMMDKIDAMSKRAKHAMTRAFGGMQVVFCGDFLQLQPIGDTFLFNSKQWDRCKFHRVDMKVPVRQLEDRSYYELLCRIRTCTFTAEDIEKLKTRMITEKEVEQKFGGSDARVKPTQIFCKNLDVDAVNQKEFKKLTTPIELVSMPNDRLVRKIKVNGKIEYEAVLDAHQLTKAREVAATNLMRRAPNKLEFRVGAQYILSYNLNVKKKLTNGSRCVYIGDNKMEFVNGQILELARIPQRFPAQDGLILIREQMPYRLGYAISIHGSQGMTLDLAVVDVGKDVFANSQVYVALSRVRSLQSLYLLRFDETKIRANPEALAFYGYGATTTTRKRKRVEE